jgi:flagellar biogenesis protein FliO
MKTPGSSSSIFGLNPALPLTVSHGDVPLKPLANSAGLLSSAWRWIRARQADRSDTKRLRVAATVSLGEKRFVAVIQIDGRQFLVGGGGTSVSLLAQLHETDSFGDLLKETMTVSNKKQECELNKTRADRWTLVSSLPGRQSRWTAKKQPAKRSSKLALNPAVERTNELW